MCLKMSPLHLIEEWYSAASNYPVSQSIWCYILPRALEILAVGEMPAHSLEIVLSRYPTGQRSNWTQAQWQILDTFQKKFIQTDIKSSHESALGHSLDDKLCMFANSGWDIDDLFEQVYSLPIQSLVETLYEDWGFHRGYFQICVTQFWGDPKKIELKWTAKFLNDRLFDYGMAPTSPKPLADKALDLVDAISAYQNDWQ